MRRLHHAPLVLATVALIAGTTPTLAQGAPSGFKSPSSNIHCQSFEDELRCDIAQIAAPIPPRPRDCDLDWGQAFAITAGGNLGARLCHGDTAMDDRLPVLPYGSVWRRDGFTCTSERTGVTCSNARGHGFSLSRNAPRLF